MPRSPRTMPPAPPDRALRRITKTVAKDPNGEVWLDMLDAAEAPDPVRLYRAEVELHRSNKKCPACGSTVPCPSHGRPAEDDGSWLWAGVA